MSENSNNSNSAPNEIQAAVQPNPASKSKSKKSKDNKLVNQENLPAENTNNTKGSKNSKKNKKKEEVDDSSKSIEVNIESKSEEVDLSNSTTSSSKKNKAKEAKEKKNKADKKHRILEETKDNTQDSKHQTTSYQGIQPTICTMSGSLAAEVAKARQHIKQSLQVMDGIAALAGISDVDFSGRVESLEKENHDLRNIVQELKNMVSKLDGRVKNLEGCGKKSEGTCALPAPQVCPAKPASKPAEKPAEKPAADDDEDVDLFGSDSEGEDAEAAKIREERLAAYNAKKSKKPVLIAKSNIILDVKPWDDETDMKVLEGEVRKIQCDGLLWGAAKLVPVAFNIKKLQISCVVEDDKVSVDWLTETIQEIEEYVQSVDIAAFNKV